MDTLIVIVVLIAAIAVIALALSQLRAQGGAGTIGGTRPPKVNRRRVAASDDPMAPVVASHSQAVEPQEAAVEELRLRAQANRVAASDHAQQAETLAGGPEAAQLQAQAHYEAAATHQRKAEELERRIPLAENGRASAHVDDPGEPGAPGPGPAAYVDPDRARR